MNKGTIRVFLANKQQINNKSLILQFQTKRKMAQTSLFEAIFEWLREPDLNQRPSGYEVIKSFDSGDKIVKQR